MAESFLHELEQASNVVLAAPNVVTDHQRRAAEEIFLRFRRSKLPYDTCTFLLEHSKNDYVLFQAASTIKECIVKEWSLLDGATIESLRKSLLQYVLHNPKLQSYVREQLLQAVAVIFKRGTIDSKEIDRDSLFSEIAQLISCGDLTMQVIACSMLTALLNEYSTTNRSSSVGLTWEFHIKCKKYFEDIELQQIFTFCIQVLSELEKQPSPLNRESTAGLNRFLAITEQVLSWNFIPPRLMRRHIGTFQQAVNVSLKPNAMWKDTMLDVSLLELILKIHLKIRHSSEMAHHSLQCLSQLASLNGAIFANEKVQADYLNQFLQLFLKFLSSYEPHDYESLGLANTLENLVLFFPVSAFLALPSEVLGAFFQLMMRLTCTFGQAAALEEALHKDDMVYMESYEKLLEAWMTLMRDNQTFGNEQLRNPATEVFNSYIQSHLSSPDGSRNQNDDIDEEYSENDEDDRDKFNEQLTSVGLFGRKIPEHSIPLLSRLLEARIAHLSGYLLSIHNSTSSHDYKTFNNLNEDIHWLILIAASVLTDHSEGETPMIPSCIMNYSISQTNHTNLQDTGKFLVTPGEHIQGLSTDNESKVDSVVRLIAAVFRLFEVENVAVDANLEQYLSPQVSRSAIWFMRRLVVGYLLPDENYYTQISISLATCFGRDSEGATWVVQYLLDKIVRNLNDFTSENDLVKDTAELLVALVENKHRCHYVIKCQTLWSLAKQQATNQPPLSNLHSAAKRMLLKGLVLAGSAVDNEHSKREYWKQVVQSLHFSLRAITCHDKFLTMYHDIRVRQQILVILESLCGVALGTQVDNMEAIFMYLHPVLTDLVHLLGICHNYDEIVQLVLEMFSETVHNMLCSLGQSNSKKLYEVCLSLLQMYSNHNADKRSVHPDAEEEKFTDILLTMELLMNLLSKDFIDFGEEEPDSGLPVEAVDIVLFGLNIIVPLMDAELLKFPTLCSQYFKLISFIAELHPAKICTLPEELFKNLMASLDLGLTSYGPDITRPCLEFLSAVAEYILEANLVGGTTHNAMGHFLKVVFQMLFIDSFDMDLMDPTSTAFFLLICCHQEKYKALVQEVLHSQTDQDYQQRLISAFNELTPAALHLNLERKNKIQFLQNLNTFLINVRGFLCVR